jgi:hypothetical protein
MTAQAASRAGAPARTRQATCSMGSMECHGARYGVGRQAGVDTRRGPSQSNTAEAGLSRAAQAAISTPRQQEQGAREASKESRRKGNRAEGHH